jgi:hypothetical protein
MTGALAPVGAQDPLPDPDALFARVRENLARAERVAHRFSYKERRTDIHTNPFGKIGTGGTSLFEVYPSATRRFTYRRLLARNEVPVSADQLSEQDRRYRIQVAEAQEEIDALNTDERRQREEELARRRSERIEDIVAALRFTIQRRSVYEGVQAVVISFTPNPNGKPTTRQGRIAQKFAGTVWVDEAAGEVMRIEATSLDDLSFGFGVIARLGRGTRAEVTRRPVEAGVWMPVELRLSGRGRAALVRRLVVDFRIEWFDYRRLPGDSLTPFLDPRVHRQSGTGPE